MLRRLCCCCDHHPQPARPIVSLDISLRGLFMSGGALDLLSTDLEGLEKTNEEKIFP
jgi:hypothetical protein